MSVDGTRRAVSGNVGRAFDRGGFESSDEEYAEEREKAEAETEA